eukprot:TRINITY_DN22929_c0_g2_i1.p1 TRINITY_DN22929_c0_g2~~TRINITY_DN22929_c0_g2_i1.p1  ORF type:complete len:839 (+),score=222.12 TRINITY_DN22929_c0_g2_i1:61-2577(+)
MQPAAMAASFTALLFGAALSAPDAADMPQVGAAPVHELAAGEVRRALRARLGAWPRVVLGGVQELRAAASGPRRTVLVGTAAELSAVSAELAAALADEWGSARDPDRHAVLTADRPGGGRVVACTGQGPSGVLYAAYSFAEALGARFDLAWDVMPPQAPPGAPPLPAVHVAARSPLFARRGVLPFHDFPMGPDWWELDQFKAVSGQLAKMRLNTWGFHSYAMEPAMWIGRPGDFDPASGKVKKVYTNASDPTEPWFSTRRAPGVNGWGLEDEATGAYCCGSAALFPSDTYASPAAAGRDPRNVSAANQAAWFNSAADLLNESFSFARRVHGVSTALGFEIPMRTAYPYTGGAEGDFMRGAVGRLAAASPVEFLWLWTQEGYSGGDVPSLAAEVGAAREAVRRAGMNATVAMAGWSLGPAGNRTAFDAVLPPDVVLSSLDGNVGWDAVDPAFGEVRRAGKWVIPWLEDDPGLAGPQLWVNRTLAHAADAARYRASGLLGIHWRTMEISPQLSALAAAGWADAPDDTDFFTDLCRRSFSLGADCVEVLLSIDSFKEGPRGPYRTCGAPRNPWGNCSTKLPSPNMGCCGRISPGPADMRDFAFAEAWSALRPQVAAVGDLDALARFDWWVAQFNYFRALGEVENAAAGLAAAAADARKQNGTSAQREAAEREVLPALRNLSRHWEVMTDWLQRSVYSTGQLGTIATNEQNNWGKVASGPLQWLSGFNFSVPGDALPSRTYGGPPRLWAVLPLRSAVAEREGRLCVRATLLGPAQAVVLSWSDANGGSGTAPMHRLAPGRGVYSGCVEPLPGADFEWHLRAGALRFPAAGNASVVLLRRSEV